MPGTKLNPPKLSRELRARLVRLEKALRAEDKFEKLKFKWDFATELSDCGSCGFAACAIGLDAALEAEREAKAGKATAPSRALHMWDITMFRSVSNAVGREMDESADGDPSLAYHAIFFEGSSLIGEDKITACDVADRIADFLAGRPIRFRSGPRGGAIMERR